MIDEFGIGHEALSKLALVVRAADTIETDLALEAAELLAASWDLCSLYCDNLAQLETGMPAYDALYRLAGDAKSEGQERSSKLIKS